MAEKNNLKSVGGTKKSLSTKQQVTATKSDCGQENDIVSRENKFKRLNEELEAKTAALVKEAENILKEQETVLAKPSLLENINTEEFLSDAEDEQGEEEVSRHRNDTRIRRAEAPVSSRPLSSRKASNKSATQAQSKPRSKTQPELRSRGKSNKTTTVADDVAVLDDADIANRMKDFSLGKTVAGIESRMDAGELSYDADDVMPSAAAEMGTEAQIRFLKAKLRVMQEELDRLAHECIKKDEECASLAGRLKDSEDERSRLQRASMTQQSQLDKYKKLADDYKTKTDSLEVQLTGAKKELDGLTRIQKQQTQTSSVTEVRLNRALEEIDKYKQQLQKTKTETKDLTDQERKRFEELVASNKRLEKQKAELISGFKKQLKLIDVLKKQKMHIEAAKVLSFTEEEFVKALEWGN